MKRGRPTFSIVRQNLIDLFAKKGPSYGYEISKLYQEIFPKVTMRLLYYHLKKGTELKELKIDKIKKVKGDYSWGNSAEKIYYSLGENSNPKKNQQIENYYDKKN